MVVRTVEAPVVVQTVLMKAAAQIQHLHPRLLQPLQQQGGLLIGVAHIIHRQLGVLPADFAGSLDVQEIRLQLIFHIVPEIRHLRLRRILIVVHIAHAGEMAVV